MCSGRYKHLKMAQVAHTRQNVCAGTIKKQEHKVLGFYPRGNGEPLHDSKEGGDVYGVLLWENVGEQCVCLLALTAHMCGRRSGLMAIRLSS